MSSPLEGGRDLRGAVAALDDATRHTAALTKEAEHVSVRCVAALEEAKRYMHAFDYVYKSEDLRLQPSLRCPLH